MSVKFLDICVVNYNTQELLKRFLDELHSDCPKKTDVTDLLGKTFYDPPWNLYIADNDSTDGSKEWLLSDDFKRNEYAITDIRLNPNIGYSNACNQLAAKGNAPIIGLLNADVWMKTEDILDIIYVFENNDDVDILGPKQRDEQNKIRHGGIFWKDSRKLLQRGWGVRDDEDIQYNDIIECATVSGSAYFIKRDVWDNLTDCKIYTDFLESEFNTSGYAKGAFLPTPHYFEETALSMHAKAHGYNIWYWGTISIGHSWHASHPVGSEMDKMFNVSRDIYRRFCNAHDIEYEL